MAKKTNDISKLSFEQAIKTLNEIVQNIESGETPLQASLEQYEEGMTLIKHCRGILQQAEKRIEKIAADSESAEDQQDEEVEDGDDESEDGLF